MKHLKKYRKIEKKKTFGKFSKDCLICQGRLRDHFEWQVLNYAVVNLNVSTLMTFSCLERQATFWGVITKPFKVPSPFYFKFNKIELKA